MKYGYGYLISSISLHCKNISVDVADQQTHTGKILYVYHMLLIATCSYRSVLRPSSGGVTLFLCMLQAV